MNSQKLKKHFYLLALLVCLLPIKTKGQGVKEWYCPKVTFNKVTFYMPDVNTGNPSDATRTMYYIDKGINCEITDVSSFQGQPIAIQKSNIKFVGNEVKLLSKVVTNSVGITNKKTIYAPIQTIFKIPIKGSTVYWMFLGQKYSSTYSTFIFNGVECSAIKVTQYQPKWNGKTVKYYMMGYGLIETDIISDNGKIIISDKFSDRIYEDGIVSSANDDKLSKQKIIITQTPQTVPSGKRWILISGKKTTVQFSDGSFNSGTFCNSMLLSNPHIIFNINKGDYRNSETFGIIFKDLAKVPYTNDYTFTLTPISIIDKKFSLGDLQYKSPENAGSREIDFNEGETVFVSNCLESIELTEIEVQNDGKKATVNASAFYNSKRNNTAGAGDGTNTRPGNQGSPNGLTLSDNYGPGGSRDDLHMTNWSFVSAPEVKNENHVPGVVVIDFTVDQNGNVIEAHPNGIKTKAELNLVQNCENAIKTSKFKCSRPANATQNGEVKFVFTVN